MSRVALSLALLLVYVLTSTTGLMLMKRAGSPLKPEFTPALFVLGFGLYGLGFLLYYALLIRMPLSVAFPLAAGALMISTQVYGYVFLDERLSGSHLLGLALILLGVGVVFHTGTRPAALPPAPAPSPVITPRR